MENVGSDANKLQKNTPPGRARHALQLAYGTTFLATTLARQKLDADEVITWSSPTVTLLSLLTSMGIRDETLDWMHSDASQLAA